MRHGSSARRLALALGALLWAGGASTAPAAAACDKPVYLTFDTGHMGVAPLVARVLREEKVQATFFLAAERTKEGGHSLDDRWAPWWRELAADGHVFGSHTWDHDVWQADLAGGHRVRPTQGPQAGQVRVLDRAAYCRELERPAERFVQMTGRPMVSVWRAPAGRVSPALLATASSCGWTHVGWTDAGFLGDELSSERFPNAALLKQALARVQPGDVLLAHLGIWSRRDPWAPAVLQPLLQGLKARGLCFATLAEHPRYGVAARTTRVAR
jgi:peptidoglycan-N-acetylmuramic acid deacetylase